MVLRHDYLEPASSEVMAVEGAHNQMGFDQRE